MVDILLNESQGLVIKNNDLVVGESNDQNIYDILISAKGEWKRTPQIGCDANNFLNSPFDSQAIKNIVRLNLELDGFTVNEVIVNNNDDIEIKPVATRK
jgi:hypothetical protein